MKFVLFSKHWKGMDLEGMIEKTRYIGADGLDLAVREGMCVSPDNVGAALPAAVKKMRDAGLDIPMITTEGGFTSVDFPSVRETAAAMREAGVPVAKLGYYHYKVGESNYWEDVKRIRDELARLEDLAREYEIKFCYHTHNNYFGSNAAGMMDLLEGRDPKYIGAFIDTGHLYYCGEPFPMAIDIVGEYLSLVSLKETGFTRQNPETEELPEWKRTILPAGYGVVKWDEVFSALVTAGYDGTCTVHCEFVADTPEEFTELQKRDVAFMREKLAAALADGKS